VRATDPAGNTDTTPASYTWSVVSQETTACANSTTIVTGRIPTTKSTPAPPALALSPGTEPSKE
jgi:hypothetical protein